MLWDHGMVDIQTTQQKESATVRCDQQPQDVRQRWRSRSKGRERSGSGVQFNLSHGAATSADGLMAFLPACAANYRTASACGGHWVSRLMGVRRRPGQTRAACAHDPPDRVDVGNRATRYHPHPPRRLACALPGSAFTRSEQAEKDGPKMRGADKMKARLNGLPFKDGRLVQDPPPEQ